MTEQTEPATGPGATYTPDWQCIVNGLSADLEEEREAHRAWRRNAEAARADIARYEDVQGEMNERAVDLTRRAEEYKQDRDQVAAVLAEVLRHFVHKGHPGKPCLSSGWVSATTVDRWRSVLQRCAGPADAGVAALPVPLDPAAVLESAATALDAQTCTCGCRRGAEFLRDRAAALRATLDSAQPAGQ
ncbi:MAG TPA: hypothetical protein VFP69_17300 [Streptomyces sp.]|nr:hypothetical protein [Streptomyces sp.]